MRCRNRIGPGSWPRWTAIVVAALVLGLAGCSAGPGGRPGFTYWSMWKIGEPQQKVISDAIADFQRETGVRVSVQWQGRSNLQKLVPALNTNSVPDLIDNSYLKLYPLLVATGQAHGLAEAYRGDVDGRGVGEVIPARYLENIDLRLPDGQPWMVPYQVQSDAIWFNAAKYPEIAANPPATWADWMRQMERIRAAGGTPLAADGDIPGYNSAYLATLLVRQGGPGTLKRIAEDRTGQAWRQPEAQAAVRQVEELVGGGHLIDGYAASKFPAQQQRWANNEAAFMFMGSWLPPESRPYAAEGFQYQSFPFPRSDRFDSQRIDFSGFAVPARARNAEPAQQFTAFMLRKKYQDAWGVRAKGIPVREDAQISAELQQVQQSMARATSYHQQNDGVAFPGYNEKVFWANSDKLFLGRVSGQRFIDAMVADQAAYWKGQGA